MSGVSRGVNELQILRDEFDIDQPAGGIFQIPAVGVALLVGDGAAHLDHVAGDHARRRAAAAEHVADRRPRHARAKSGGAETTRARVSAMCSQVQASLS